MVCLLIVQGLKVDFITNPVHTLWNFSMWKFTCSAAFKIPSMSIYIAKVLLIYCGFSPIEFNGEVKICNLIVVDFAANSLWICNILRKSWGKKTLLKV